MLSSLQERLRLRVQGLTLCCLAAAWDEAFDVESLSRSPESIHPFLGATGGEPLLAVRKLLLGHDPASLALRQHSLCEATMGLLLSAMKHDRTSHLAIGDDTDLLGLLHAAHGFHGLHGFFHRGGHGRSEAADCGVDD